MAGTETYTVVLDANVLYPIAVIDLVFSLVGTNLFYARWSDDIATEAVTAVEPLTARSIESFSLPPLSRYAAREPEKSRLLEEGNYLLYIDLLSNAVLKAGTEI
jgi:hypothetical protein